MNREFLQLRHFPYTIVVVCRNSWTFFLLTSPKKDFQYLVQTWNFTSRGKVCDLMKNLFSRENISLKWKAKSEKHHKVENSDIKDLSRELLFYPFFSLFLLTKKRKKKVQLLFRLKLNKNKMKSFKIAFQAQRNETKRRRRKNHRNFFLLQHEKETYFYRSFIHLGNKLKIFSQIAALYSTYFVYHSIHHDILHIWEGEKGFNIEKWRKCLMWSPSRFFISSHMSQQRSF